MKKKRNSTVNGQEKNSDSEYNSVSELNSEMDEEMSNVSVSTNLVTKEKIQKYVKILYVLVSTAVDHKDREIANAFKILPNKDEWPLYYKIIDNPIDLKIIGTRIQNNEYTSITSFSKDVTLLIRNAKDFNEPQSQIYKDANRIKQLLSKKTKEVHSIIRGNNKINAVDIVAIMQNHSNLVSFDQVMEGILEFEKKIFAIVKIDPDQKEIVPENVSKINRKRKRPDSGESDIDYKMSKLGDKQRGENVTNFLNNGKNDQIEEIIKFVKQYVTQCHHTVANFYLVKGSQPPLKPIFKSITHLIDLRMIENRIRDDKYSSVMHFFSDIELLTSNALSINWPNSIIYQCTKSMVQDLETMFGFEPKSYEILPINDGNKFSMEEKNRITAGKVQAKETDSSDSTFKIQSNADFPNKEAMRELSLRLARIAHTVTLNSSKNSIMLAILHYLINFSEDYPLSSDEEDDDEGKEAIQNNTFNNSTVFLSNKRYICSEFYHLPSKEYYPSYYEVIKRPMSINKIELKIFDNQYAHVNDFIEDCMRMFNNAMIYNEINSTIYRDAITLAIATIMRRDEILGKENSQYPNVNQKMQEIIKLIMNDLLACVYVSNQSRTSEGTELLSDILSTVSVNISLSNSLNVTPKADISNSSNINILPKTNREVSLKLIQNNVDKGLYKYFFVFQQDLLSLLPECRRIDNNGNSKILEAYFQLIELYIVKRDEYSRNGDLFTSSAFNYTMQNLTIDRERIKHEKLISLGFDIKKCQKSETKDLNKTLTPEKFESAYDSDGYVIPRLEIVTCETEDTSVPCKFKFFEQVYNPKVGWIQVGDFAYLTVNLPTYGINYDNKNIKDIVRVDRIWVNVNEEYSFAGIRILRLESICANRPTRMFYFNEVIPSNIEVVCRVDNIQKLCSVLHIEDFCHMSAIGFEFNDRYIYCMKYQEAEKVTRKMLKSIKAPKKSNDAALIECEFFNFKEKIIPTRVPSTDLKNWLNKTSEDVAVLTVKPSERVTSPVPINKSILHTPSTLCTKKRPRARRSKKFINGIPTVKATGYTMYSNETRKDITSKFPDRSFGEISKFIGQAWRTLDREKKAAYELKAKNYVYEKNMEIQFQSSNNLNQTVNQNQMGQMYQNQMLPNSQFNQLNYHNASSDNLMYSSVGNFMYNQQPTIPSQINNSYSQINNILNSEGGSFKNNYNRYPPGRVHITYSNQNANPANAKILLQKPTQNLFLNENVMFVPPPKKQDKIFHSDNYTRYIDKIITNNSGYSTLKAPQQNQDIDIPQRLPLDWFDNVNPTIDKRKMTKYLWDVRDALIQSLL